jgi:hypothetical protein
MIFFMLEASGAVLFCATSLSMVFALSGHGSKLRNLIPNQHIDVDFSLRTCVFSSSAYPGHPAHSRPIEVDL